ncbi:MAG: hypothetical protein KFH98_04435 [Gemmatimonadetes bacterium]|nr:hypothetical protein [Gemmatimonadota bacterium]
MRIWILAIGLLLAACAADEAAFGVSDERFIATMVDLRQAAVTAGTDTAQFELLREGVLARHGVSEDELRTYIEMNSGDLNHMAAIWDSIAARLSDPLVE